jgi:hypothetical protein
MSKELNEALEKFKEMFPDQHKTLTSEMDALKKDTQYIEGERQTIVQWEKDSKKLKNLSEYKSVQQLLTKLDDHQKEKKSNYVFSSFTQKINQTLMKEEHYAQKANKYYDHDAQFQTDRTQNLFQRAAQIGSTKIKRSLIDRKASFDIKKDIAIDKVITTTEATADKVSYVKGVLGETWNLTGKKVWDKGKEITNHFSSKFLEKEKQLSTKILREEIKASREGFIPSSKDGVVARSVVLATFKVKNAIISKFGKINEKAKEAFQYLHESGKNAQRKSKEQRLEERLTRGTRYAGPER